MTKQAIAQTMQDMIVLVRDSLVLAHNHGASRSGAGRRRRSTHFWSLAQLTQLTQLTQLAQLTLRAS